MFCSILEYYNAALWWAGLTILIHFSSRCCIVSAKHVPLPCERSKVKEAVYSCTENLAAMQVAILVASGSNYSHVCSAFSDYVRCVEPKVYGCRPEQFVVLRQYADDKVTYTRGPYSCPMPYVPTPELETITTYTNNHVSGAVHTIGPLSLGRLSAIAWLTYWTIWSKLRRYLT